MNRFVAESGLSLREVCDVVIPARTLKHRKQRMENLSRDESDKLARLIRAFDTAAQVFGDSEKGRRWLEKPKQRFEGRTPLQMLRTETGGLLVEGMLIQIDEGMFA